MSSARLFGDSVVLSAASIYPERAEAELPWHDRLAETLYGRLWLPIMGSAGGHVRELKEIVSLTTVHANECSNASDDELLVSVRTVRATLRRKGFAPDLVGHAFALVREVAFRTIGQRHFDTQIMGGWALLQGKLAEMATGEGKTLVASLAVSTAALAGVPVHVITVNDYLAERDAEAMAPIYRYLGLSVGVVIQGISPDVRRKAYGCDVTYCTNKELAFDYLRDRVTIGQSAGRLNMALDALRDPGGNAPQLLLRGLHFAIVDEADSVFIDEARTPLILSSTVDGKHDLEMFNTALEIAKGLSLGEDYKVNERQRHVTLTDSGKARLREMTSEYGGVWTSVRGRQELVTQGLSALLFYLRDKHYVISEGKVQIVDESTGRVMPDRSWERGLHQMIEAKEGCDLSAGRETIARITYQRLFRRYLLLAGMTGTGREVAREMRAVYRLSTVSIPLNRPSRRRYFRGRVYATTTEKWDAISSAVKEIAVLKRRPVLIGTRSVEASEQLSQVLSESGIEHALLNAKQDNAEAAVIAQAGQAGRVTVSTNMAGRGTDIRLDTAAVQNGGLHVILTECHTSARVDRQLFGRGARQGDPGSCQMIVSLQDEVFRVYGGALTVLAYWLIRLGPALGSAALTVLRYTVQSQAERRDARVRRDTLAQDRQLDKTLAFSGKHE